MTETEGIRKNKKYLDIKDLVLYENGHEKHIKRWNNYNSSTFIYVRIKAYVSNYVRKGLKLILKTLKIYKVFTTKML